MCKQCLTSIFRFNISFPLFYSFLFSSSFNLQITVPQASFSGFSLLQGRVLNQICLFFLLTLFSIETTSSLQQLSDGIDNGCTQSVWELPQKPEYFVLNSTCWVNSCWRQSGNACQASTAAFPGAHAITAYFF